MESVSSQSVFFGDGQTDVIQSLVWHQFTERMSFWHAMLDSVIIPAGY